MFKTRMSGFFQTAFYFGYTAMACFGKGGGRFTRGRRARGWRWRSPWPPTRTPPLTPPILNTLPGLALMTGAVGYWAASAFVRTIYRQVKCD